MAEEIARWTARRESALVLEIIQGKATVSEASRQFDLATSEIEEWIKHAKAGMENDRRAKPEDVREQYERQFKGLQEAYGEAMYGLRARMLGRQLSRSDRASTAAAALEQALITRYGTLGRVPVPFLLRQTTDRCSQAGTSRGWPQLRAEAGVHHPALPPTRVGWSSVSSGHLGRNASADIASRPSNLRCA